MLFGFRWNFILSFGLRFLRRFFIPFDIHFRSFSSFFGDHSFSFVFVFLLHSRLAHNLLLLTRINQPDNLFMFHLVQSQLFFFLFQYQFLSFQFIFKLLSLPLQNFYFFISLFLNSCFFIIYFF